MGRFDQHTLDFMEKVATDGETPAEHKPDLTALRTMRSIVKSLADPQKAIGKALVSSATMKTVFDKEASLSVLGIYGILNDAYERAWWEWEPETLWQTLKLEHGIETTDELKNLIMALQLTVKTNQPFENWHVFEKVGHAFNFNPVNFSLLQPLEPHEAALALALLRKIRGDTPYESEICGYLAASAKNAGLVYLDPEIFTANCQAFLDKMGNNIHLKNAVMQKRDIGTAAYKIQVARLKEITLYVKKGLS